MEKRYKAPPKHILDKWLLDKRVITQKEYEARQGQTEEKVLCRQVEDWLIANEESP